MAVRIYDAEMGDGFKEGKVLWPEVRPYNWLAGKKRNTPGPVYRAQYRNDPSGLRGVRYDLNWVHFYRKNELPPMRELVGVQGGDPATSKSSSADYFGHCTLAKDNATGIVYVLDFTFDRVEAPSHLQFLETQFLKWSMQGLQVQTVFLEEVGPQQSTTQNLAVATRVSSIGPMPLTIVRPTGSKEQRLDAMMRFVGNGTILFPGEESEVGEMSLPLNHRGFQEFQTEFTQFPRGSRDDVLDALWVAGHEFTGIATAASYDQSVEEQRTAEEVEQEDIRKDGVLDMRKEHMKVQIAGSEEHKRIDAGNSAQRVLGGRGMFHF